MRDIKIIILTMRIARRLGVQVINRLELYWENMVKVRAGVPV